MADQSAPEQPASEQPAPEQPAPEVRPVTYPNFADKHGGRPVMTPAQMLSILFPTILHEGR